MCRHPMPLPPMQHRLPSLIFTESVWVLRRDRSTFSCRQLLGKSVAGRGSSIYKLLRLGCSRRLESVHGSKDIHRHVINGALNGRYDVANAREVKHVRSEEHTSELQSQSNLVCRLLLEIKKD